MNTIKKLIKLKDKKTVDKYNNISLSEKNHNPISSGYALQRSNSVLQRSWGESDSEHLCSLHSPVEGWAKGEYLYFVSFFLLYIQNIKGW